MGGGRENRGLRENGDLRGLGLGAWGLEVESRAERTEGVEG